jgi:oligoendopeptidase F
MSTQKIVWNLENLYKENELQEIENDKILIKQLVEKFILNYKNKLNSKKIETNFILNALQDYEKIYEYAYIIYSYFSYKKHQNNLDENISGKYQEINEFITEIENKLMFFELELLSNSEEELVKLANSSNMEKYREYLQKEIKFKKFRLSEKEEIILNKKSQTSSSAFSRLYDELQAANEFSIKLDNKRIKLTYSQLSKYLSSYNNRTVRLNAAKSLTKRLKTDIKKYTFILNHLLLDKQISDEIRNFSSPQEATLIAYQINQNTVDSMSNTITNNYNMVSDFYKYKSSIQNLNELNEVDRYSQIIESKKNKTYTWDQAKKIILDSFNEFSPIFTNIAEKFFDNGWIDASIYKGKSNGAFCSYCVPSKNPYILLNFSGRAEDIRVLAHELGHGIHAYLSRKQNLLQYSSSTAVAEIASVFCEKLVFDKLFQMQNDKVTKINLLGNKIQESFATIFRQNAFHIFETQLHNLRKKGELSSDNINNLFQNTLQEMFGNSLHLSDDHKYWWIPVGHFFHYNFYVFTYCFGESLANSLFNVYKSNKSSFVDNYISALEFGGSKDPYELTKLMGVDVNDEQFWNGGLKIINNYIETIKKL